MREGNLLPFHLDCLERYLAYWDQPSAAEAAGVSREVAAYHLLEHAGKLCRLTCDPSCVHALRGLDSQERRELVLAACRYIAETRIASRSGRLLTNDCLSTEDLDEMESVVLRTDALELVLDLAGKLSRDLLDEADVPDALGGALSLADEIVSELYARPDCISVAWRILADEDGDVPGWLRNARALDRRYHEVPLHQLLAAEAGRNANGVFFAFTLAAKPPPSEAAEIPLAMAADASSPGSAAHWLESSEGLYLKIIRDVLADTIALRLIDGLGLAGSVANAQLLIRGRPLTLLQPFDHEGYAIVRAVDLDPVLQQQAELKLQFLE